MGSFRLDLLTKNVNVLMKRTTMVLIEDDMLKLEEAMKPYLKIYK